MRTDILLSLILDLPADVGSIVSKAITIEQEHLHMQRTRGVKEELERLIRDEAQDALKREGKSE